MGDAGPGDVTVLLKAMRSGAPGAADRLMSLVYGELKRIAQNRLGSRGEHRVHDATTVVHEAYLRLFAKDDPGWENRHHFFWAAARAMRDILVERARSQGALKRGGTRKRVALGEGLAEEAGGPDVLALDESLARLELVHPDAARLVMLRFFGGLSREHIANMLGVSEAKVWREWQFAKAWLSADLERASLGETGHSAAAG